METKIYNNFRINTELQTPPVSLKGRVTIVAEQKEKRVQTHTKTPMSASGSVSSGELYDRRTHKAGTDHCWNVKNTIIHTESSSPARHPTQHTSTHDTLINNEVSFSKTPQLRVLARCGWLCNICIYTSAWHSMNLQWDSNAWPKWEIKNKSGSCSQTGCQPAATPAEWREQRNWEGNTSLRAGRSSHLSHGNASLQKPRFHTDGANISLV